MSGKPERRQASGEEEQAWRAPVGPPAPHTIRWRRAPGAGPRSILATVLGTATLLLALGIGVGMARAFLGARTVESLLYGVAPLDAPTLVAVPLVPGAIGLLAALLPALRAARIDPLVALRQG